MKVNLKNRKFQLLTVHISHLYMLLLDNSTGYCIMTTPFDYVFDNVYMYDIKYKLPLGEQCNLL